MLSVNSAKMWVCCSAHSEWIENNRFIQWALFKIFYHFLSSAICGFWQNAFSMQIPSVLSQFYECLTKCLLKHLGFFFFFLCTHLKLGKPINEYLNVSMFERGQIHKTLLFFQIYCLILFPPGDLTAECMFEICSTNCNVQPTVVH